MNTQENNKLIAEFMQLPTEIFQPRGTMNYGMDDSWYEEHELSYHLSWNWLMPVVHKCLKIYHIEQKNDDLHFKFYDAFRFARFNWNLQRQRD